MTTSTDFTFYLGETWEIDATIRDAEGNLLDVTTAEWRVASKTGLILKVQIANGITVVSKGHINIQIPPAMQTTSNVAAGSYYHELFASTATLDGSIQNTGNVTIKSSLKTTYP